MPKEISWFRAADVAHYNDQFSNREITKHVNFWPDAERHPVSGSTRIGNSPVSLPFLSTWTLNLQCSQSSPPATFEAHRHGGSGPLFILCFEISTWEGSRLEVLDVIKVI